LPLDWVAYRASMGATLAPISARVDYLFDLTAPSCLRLATGRRRFSFAFKERAKTQLATWLK
jgi:hypothetical protein